MAWIFDAAPASSFVARSRGDAARRVGKQARRPTAGGTIASNRPERSSEARGGERAAPQRRERRGEAPRRRDDTSQDREPIVLGLLAAPGLTYELAEQLVGELHALLRRRFPDFEWRVVLRSEPMAAASESDVDLVEIAHQRMLAEGWKLAVCLTDFPVHVGNRPVTAHASATYGVGLISVPALGAVNLEERVRDAVVRIVEGLLGESVQEPEEARDAERQDRMRGRLQDLSSPSIGQAEVPDERTFRFVAAVGLGNLRLLFGMVRANRPWRLIAGLSRALVAALSLDIFGVASPGVWMIADGLDWVRLVVVSVASVLVTCVTLITAHGLWHKTYDETRPEARERTILFNLATAITVAIGVLTLYVALLIINVIVGLLVIPTDVLQRNIMHQPNFGTFVALSALVSTLATLGGALGAALENDRAVREAAYGYNPDARTEALQ